MSDKEQYFHLTIGPVQGFIAQARRTRDFWAGSFLLSWLTAVAIKATEAQGGTVLFPGSDGNFLAFMEGDSSKGTAPQQGSIPNRFKASVDEGFDAKLVTQAVQDVWCALAEFIWAKDIAPAFKDNNDQLIKSKEIWERQISNFWDITWVITADIEDSTALDQRKNWRTWFLPNEPGVKCSVMGDLQEISGAKRPNRAELDAFWKVLRNNRIEGIENDFAEKEAVCAITYVKRRFSRYFKGFETKVGGLKLKGWDVPTGVPSVSFMAAVHWLEKASEKVDKKLLGDFTEKAKNLTGSYGERKTKIACLDNDLINKLDGNVFYKNNLENPEMFVGKETEKKELLSLLQQINSTKDMEPISPFYAILMMDGDSLGIQMSDEEKQSAIAKGLNTFTREVLPIVQKHNGFLIYAGGDDVLAILPLEDALPCAIVLRDFYLSCFKGATVTTTLSGAIEYAHVKTPLGKVLKEAHDLLDNIAKEQTGRDAIAIRVWNLGGLQLQWAQPWEIALNGNRTYLQELTEQLNPTDGIDNEFSNSFFYKIRERFKLLNAGDTGAKLNSEFAISLMAVDYLQSGKTKVSLIKESSERMRQAKAIVEPLINQCIPRVRDPEKDKSEWEAKSLIPDAALLIRFLAQKGAER